MEETTHDRQREVLQEIVRLAGELDSDSLEWLISRLTHVELELAKVHRSGLAGEVPDNELSLAWQDFVLVMARSLYLDRACGWLEKHLESLAARFGRG